ncbi:GNAT family N-acetyltransferase [Streptomyces sp. HNM0574]|uniref:GNAT family N-acetyltransferase n=1 Tax=Streptomyces sp. HNM0574 TaxID=2714954 RepID=UPI00146C798C|nr:GNAT family N-acetyltransferase [Streptomyces sp. HNM0574]NLU66758.1 GNAT family N-acetyltransferase [Streptomyces sp. HNM0574]
MTPTRPGAPVVERAGAGDADALTALVHASRAYEGRYASIIAGYRVTPAYLTHEQVWKAVEPSSGRLFGFCSLLLGAEPPELDLAFVADEAQGRGIGRLLLDHVRGVARAAGHPAIRIVSHPPAEAFYLRVGAERVGTVPASPPHIPWGRPELMLGAG